MIPKQRIMTQNSPLSELELKWSHKKKYLVNFWLKSQLVIWLGFNHIEI